MGKIENLGGQSMLSQAEHRTRRGGENACRVVLTPAPPFAHSLTSRNLVISLCHECDSHDGDDDDRAVRTVTGHHLECP